MKYLSIVLLVLVLNCQKKTSSDINNKKHSRESASVLAKDTDQKIENIHENKLDVTDTVSHKLPEKEEKQSAEADSDFQWEANKKLSKLVKFYGDNLPDYYGGGFIDDKGKLVINIKGKLENGRTKVINIIGSDNIKFQSTKYSNKELLSIMNYLNDFAKKPENKKFMTNLSGWSQMEDYIEVCFKKLDKNSKADFKKYILDSDAIRFKECGEFRFN